MFEPTVQQLNKNEANKRKESIAVSSHLQLVFNFDHEMNGIPCKIRFSKRITMAIKSKFLHQKEEKLIIKFKDEDGNVVKKDCPKYTSHLKVL